MLNAEALRQLAERASAADDAPMVCLCVLDRGWPAFVFHANDPDRRRSPPARALVEMVLQVARPVGHEGRIVTSRTALIAMGCSLVVPIATKDGVLGAAIGVASLDPRGWSAMDMQCLIAIGTEVVRLVRRDATVPHGKRRDRQKPHKLGTSRRHPRLKSSW